MTSRDCVRCKFIKGDGQRCIRNTCIRKDYCWQHLRAKKDIDIRPSRIKKAGKGLFAFKNFKKGAKIASYTGDIVRPANVKDPQYAVQWKKNRVLDSSSTQDGLGRYSNNCRGKNKRKGQCNGNNAKLARDYTRRKMSLKATKKIKKGQEIFNGSYGRSFRIV